MLQREYISKDECPHHCQEHNFQFKPNYSKCWIKYELDIRYCPQYTEYYFKHFQQLKVRIVAYRILFQFSIMITNLPFRVLYWKQIKYFILPFIILNLIKALYQVNFNRYQEEHQKKIFEQTFKKTQLHLPKPNKRHRYCGVCRQNYDEYRDHLNSKEHRDKFQNNKFKCKIESIIKERFMPMEDQISEQSTMNLFKNIQPTKETNKMIPEPPKKKRGRPKLTSEEKSKRKSERELKNNITKKIKQG